MGSIYVGAMRNISSPRVGLLSIGEEDTKGNEASLAALKLLRKSGLHFAGNVEGRDIFSGELDVVVCDGFTGNILLKFGESVPKFFKAKFQTFAKTSVWNSTIALLAKNGLRRVMKEMDYQEAGGVPLLGVNGVVIIGHGKSSPKAIKNMIFRAEEMIRSSECQNSGKVEPDRCLNAEPPLPLSGITCRRRSSPTLILRRWWTPPTSGYAHAQVL
jgi:glycerol-3-phosphate acyltransferase PlsX